MDLLNSIDIDTQWGMRSFELWHGDVTNLDFIVDLLVISTVGSDFSPLSGTVVGALSSRLGISVERLRNPNSSSSSGQVAYGFQRLLIRGGLAELCAWKSLMGVSMLIRSCSRYSEACQCLKREDCP